MRAFHDNLLRLGGYPAEDKIRSLTEQARMLERQDSRNVMRLLLNEYILRTQPPNRVPALYVVDSILKNVGGRYPRDAEPFMEQAICETFRLVSDKDKDRLVRLVKTWERRAPPPFSPPIFHKIYAFMNPWIEQQARSHPPAQSRPAPAHTPPPEQGDRLRKRIRVDFQVRIEAEAKKILSQLQQELEEPNPVSLEKLRELEPDQAAGIEQIAVENVKKEVGELPLAGNITSTKRLKPLVQQSVALCEAMKEVASQSGDLGDGVDLTKPRHSEAVLSSARLLHTVLAQIVDHSQTKIAASDKLLSKDLRSRQFPPMRADSLAVKDPEAIKQLLRLPFVCPSDAMRFRTQEEVHAHEEILEHRKAASNDSRAWYCNTQAWIMDTPINASTEETTTSAQQPMEDTTPEEEGKRVLKDDMITHCRICGDPFVHFHDSQTEEWLFKNAVRVRILEDEGIDAAEVLDKAREFVLKGGGDETLVHRTCLRDLDPAMMELACTRRTWLLPEEELQGDETGGGLMEE